MDNRQLERLELQSANERELLGTVLRNDGVMDDVAFLLSEDDFRESAHRSIWRALQELYRENRPIAPFALGDRLQRMGEWDNIGRAAYLVRLWEQAGTGMNVVYAAKLVQGAALLRRLAAAGAEIAQEATAPTGDAEHVLESAEQKIFALGETGRADATVTVGQTLPEVWQRIDERNRRGDSLSGLATGFTDLDDLTAGLQQSECTVIAARPGVGKTALAVALAAHAALDQNTGVFFASLEMSRHELTERLLCSRLGISSSRMRRGTLWREEQDRVAAAGDILDRAPLHIDDTPRQSMLRIGANARRLKRKFGIGLVLVDYLQLVEPDDKRVARYEQVGAISRRLKILARELALPVVALAQLNREAENRKGERPKLSDLRESGGIEQDADTVVLLHKPTDQPRRDVQTLEFLVAKQRNGPLGEVAVHFTAEQLRFDAPPPVTPFDNEHARYV